MQMRWEGDIAFCRRISDLRIFASLIIWRVYAPKTMAAAILEYIWSVSALGAIAALIIVPWAPKVIHPNHKAPYG